MKVNICIIFTQILLFLSGDSKYSLMKVYIYIIFILIELFLYAYISAEIYGPLLCEHVDDLRDGTIARTPLLQQGQTIKTLAHGTYNVTGGTVEIGYLGGGKVTKIVGITAYGNIPNTFTYTPNTQPFNGNLASVFYEMREAGQKHVSHSALDYTFAGRQLIAPAGYNYAMYLESYRASAGMSVSQYGETAISNNVINGLAR